MSTLLKKVVLSFLSSLILLLSFAPFLSVNAAATPAPSTSSGTTPGATWYAQDFQTWYSKVSDSKNPSEIFGERYTSAQVEWVIYGLFAFFINHLAPPGTAGPCISGDIVACTAGIKTFLDSIKTTEVINTNQSLTSLIFADRPLSGISYVREKFGSFKLVPEVHAQTGGGTGFTAFNPVQGLWRASRNFAYFLSVIGVIALAFMIMFRVKISPQVIISVQSAIPKVVLALILITFSYAIAGLVVDLMYVVIGTVSLFLTQYLGTNNPATVYSFLVNGPLNLGFIGLMNFYFYSFFVSLMVTLFLSGTPLVTSLLAFSGILPLIYILIIIVVAVMLIFIEFKVLWLLLKTLAMTYLLVIVGPIQIVLSVIMPTNQNVGFGSWLRSLASNVAVYPVVGTLFAVSYIFLKFGADLALTKVLGSGAISAFFQKITGYALPPAQGGWTPPLTAGESYLPLLFLGVSFFIITLIPKAAEIIQGLISGKPFDYGTAIGEALGPVVSGAKLGAGLYVSSTEAADEVIRRQGKQPQVDYFRMLLQNTLLKRN